MSIAEVQSPVTLTESGMVMGREKRGVFLFSGIPYAESPQGDNRFKRAQPVTAWDDVRDATRFGLAAPQLPSGSMTNNVPVPWSEDCLSLNICTPAIDQKKRPVMVWIHGGAYRSGQGAVPWYNGTSFALNGDIVTVTINYRLGALGFTDLSRFGDEFATSGINGILDQITALQWVQRNIAHFGGDPDQVTIAGESAGGFSVATLLGSPMAKGLFARAIPQSGAAHETLDVDQGKQVADIFLEELGATTIDDVLAASATDVLEAQGRADVRFEQSGAGRGVFAFYPVEGNEVLPAPLLQLVAEGAGSDIPVLTGTNKDEMTLFFAGSVSPEKLQAQASRYGGGAAMLAAYRKLMPGASDTELSVAMGTDFTFKIPALRMAEMRAAHGGETWLYQFDWESRQGGLKSTHALEIPFTFNTLDAPGVDFFLGAGDLPSDLATEMHQVWTQFIQGDAPNWPAYSAERRSVQHFDQPSSMIEHDDETRISIWAGIR